MRTILDRIMEWLMPKPTTEMVSAYRCCSCGRYGSECILPAECRFLPRHMRR